MSNVVALEGAEVGVACNVIVPAALTRLAEGLDTSAYPPMGPELTAPAVGWLAHESCSITGEMLVAIAGRVARAYLAETPGVYQPSWTIEDVAARTRRDPRPGRLLGAARRPLRPHRPHHQEFRDDNGEQRAWRLWSMNASCDLFEAEGINTRFGVADPSFVHLSASPRNAAGRWSGRITRSRPGSWPRRCPG